MADFAVLNYDKPCSNCGSQYIRVLQYGPGAETNREVTCICGVLLFLGDDDRCKGSRNVTLAHLRDEVEAAFRAHNQQRAAWRREAS